MGQQLESVAMGLVSLGHLALREVRLGLSRNARLVQEKELLEELLNLRQWISNRMAPTGWDPGKLTTIALRCAYPREDEPQLPLPQLPLKGMVAAGSEEMRSTRRRLPSADPVLERPAAEGAKTAPMVVVKPPLTARTLSASGPPSLPPLQIAAVA